MADVKLTPQEQADLDARKKGHDAQQPYATELDNRELEHAHKEKRPVDPLPNNPNPDA